MHDIAKQHRRRGLSRQLPVVLDFEAQRTDLVTLNRSCAQRHAAEVALRRKLEPACNGGWWLYGLGFCLHVRPRRTLLQNLRQRFLFQQLPQKSVGRSILASSRTRIQEQVVGGTGHGYIKQPALFFMVQFLIVFISAMRRPPQGIRKSEQRLLATQGKRSCIQPDDVHLLPLQPFRGVYGEQADRIQLVVRFLQRDRSASFFEKLEIFQKFVQRAIFGNRLLLPLVHKIAEYRQGLARAIEAESFNDSANRLRSPRIFLQPATTALYRLE